MSDEQPKHEQFQYWLASMDEAIDAFLSGLPESQRTALDQTPASLAALEQLLLARYASPSEARPQDQAKFLDGAARYFGEVLRKGTGAKWELRTSDPKSVFYGVPVLFGGKIASVPVCPLTSVTASLDRRTGVFLKKVYDNMTST
jgi:hypothetical protein